jgi:hypothetical protein
VFALAAAILFLLGAIFEAVNGASLDHNPYFWLLAGLSAWAFEAVLGDRVGLGRRRG